MRALLKSVVLMFMFSTNVYAQDTLNYAVHYFEGQNERTKEEIRFIQRLKDSYQVELLFGTGFNDTVKIYCLDSEIFNGLLKTNYSVSMVNMTFLINRNSNEITIAFPSRAILVVPILPDYNYILIGMIKNEYSVNYYKNFN